MFSKESLKWEKTLSTQEDQSGETERRKTSMSVVEEKKMLELNMGIEIMGLGDLQSQFMSWTILTKRFHDLQCFCQVYISLAKIDA